MHVFRVFQYFAKNGGSYVLFTDLQVLFLAKTTLKLGLTTLFTHLKIILLQYF